MIAIGVFVCALGFVYCGVGFLMSAGDAAREPKILGAAVAYVAGAIASILLAMALASRVS